MLGFFFLTVLRIKGLICGNRISMDKAAEIDEKASMGYLSSFSYL